MARWSTPLEASAVTEKAVVKDKANKIPIRCLRMGIFYSIPIRIAIGSRTLSCPPSRDTAESSLRPAEEAVGLAVFKEARIALGTSRKLLPRRGAVFTMTAVIRKPEVARWGTLTDLLLL